MNDYSGAKSTRNIQQESYCSSCFVYKFFRDVSFFFMGSDPNVWRIMLRGQLFVRIVVVLPFREQYHWPTDGQQTEVGNADAELYTA